MIVKRAFDIAVSLFGLLVFSPVLLVTVVAVWLQDFKNPLYIPQRVGRDGRLFKMVKIRSMCVGADKSGVDSTASSDARITLVGKIIRKFKLDELAQLWNVLVGDMSLVGPRPNVEREVNLYTQEEKGLLALRPGITDISSIVFSDEGDILEGKPDPDLAYNQLIRPWKNRLGLYYIENRSLMLDCKLILFTVLAAFSKEMVLKKLSSELARKGAPADLVNVTLRQEELMPTAPPGATEIVMER